MTAIILISLFAVALFLVVRWENITKKDKAKVIDKLDWWEEKLS